LTGFANRIFEIERSKVRVFEGGYQDYRRARALLDRQAWSAYEAFERRKAALDRAAPSQGAALGARGGCAGGRAWRQGS
jgi:ATPase subunit of ABC transporter with duplicated ATPase domains